MKAKSQEEYATSWKNSLTHLKIVQGDIIDTNPDLADEIENQIVHLCDLIDKASFILDDQGVFD